MNVTFIRLKSVISELRGIRKELERLADCWEAELSEVHRINMRPPKADTSGPEPTVVYTDEEEGWARESIERLKRDDEFRQREDV